MSRWNKVTEQGPVPDGADLWLVSVEWRGGHDKRVIRLQNLYLSEKEARSAWEAQTLENHNKIYHPSVDDPDSSFVRLPLRCFTETPLES